MLTEQIVHTCASGERNKEGEPKQFVMVFGYVVDDDGTKYAIVSQFPVKVPINEIVVYEQPIQRTKMRHRVANLPVEDQDLIFDAIGEAIAWGGWDDDKNAPFGNGTHAKEAIDNIIAVFEKNGIHFPQYT